MKPESVLLALETSGKSGSVAIVREQNGSFVYDTEQLSPESGSAKTLAPAIERLMAMHRIEMQSLCAIALLTGPGSFTGLRVGVATAKAMAYALRIPTVEIDTLDVIAHQCPVVSHSMVSPSLHVILDAYRGQVFVAEYSIRTVGATQVIEKVSNTEIVDIDVLLERARLQVEPQGTIDLCGPGCDRIRRFLSELENGRPEWMTGIVERIRWIDGSATLPNAETVARLGIEKFRAGQVLDPFLLKPQYYRGSAAEEVASKGKPSATLL